MIAGQTEDVKTFGDYWAVLKRRRRYVFVIGLVLAVVTVIVALALPPVYRSSATILIEQQEIPEDLVRSTITSYADQRIQVISQRVMTRANLLAIVNKYNLYAEDRESEPLETIIEQMREDIAMNTISADVIDPRSGRPTVATIAFSLAYVNENPGLAQRVTNELASLYLNENLKSRAQLTSETAHFLTEEVDKLSVIIAALEKKLATFKEQNYESLPEMGQLNIQFAQRTEQDLELAERDLVSARERQTYLEAQLTQLSPYTGMRAETGESILMPRDRLQVAKSQLASLTGLYTDTHPEVARLRREIAGLESQLAESSRAAPVEDDRAVAEFEQRLAQSEAELSAARQRYTSDHPDVSRLEREVNTLRASLVKARKASREQSAGANEDISASTNPAYVQLQAQLENVKAELRSAAERRDRLREQVIDYQKRLATAPQVEREYRELTRDHENAWAKYRDLKAKQMEAQLAESLETGRKGERFTLIEPPELPEKPIKPNRLLILVMGLLAAVGAGIGGAFLRDSLDETVHGRRDLSTWFDVPALVTVPYIITAAESTSAARRRAMIVAGGLVAMVAAIAAVHFAYMPLDVLLYAGMRRFGW